jgi:LruC domain-containing protein
MRHYQKAYAAIAIALALASCSRNKADVVTPPEETLTVPSSFTWETTRAVAISIQSGDANANGLLYRVGIYTGNPASSAPINNGAVGYGYPYRLTINLPVTTHTLYLKVASPTGGESIVSQEIGGSTLTYTIPATTKARNSALKSVASSGPDCSTGCTTSISGSGTATITGGSTYCITSSFTGDLNFDSKNGGGTVRICGSATIKTATLGASCNLVVAEGGTLDVETLTMNDNAQLTAWPNATVKVAQLNMNSATSTITSYTTNLSVTKNFSPNGIITNFGKLEVAGNLVTGNNNGSISNSGTIRVLGNIDVNQGLTNNGTIEADGKISFNSANNVTNTCRIVSHSSISIHNGSLTCNTGLLHAYTSMDITGTAAVTLQNQSMLKATDITTNANLSGSGSLSSVVSTGSGTITGNAQVSGAIEWADASGSLKNGSAASFVNGATLVKLADATNYIPTSACNPEGIGKAKDIDKDGDGVADSLDDYPLDPDRAFDSYFPSRSGFASYAFEDLWPSTGDYDFNDLVVNARLKYVTNARNLVVEIVGKYYVAAVGGSYKSGLGLQLDKLLPGDIKSVVRSNINIQGYVSENSNGTENGPDKAVVILWDNSENMIHRAGGSMFNVVTGNPVGKSDTLNITIALASPKTVSEVGTMPLNHFLIKNLERKVEIHLPNALPTSLASTSLFGTSNDASKPSSGKYYITSGNLPWALYLPSQFDYPSEKSNILKAHTKFKEWAESGGALYPDWFSNTQYRDGTYIYQK